MRPACGNLYSYCHTNHSMNHKGPWALSMWYSGASPSLQQSCWAVLLRQAQWLLGIHCRCWIQGILTYPSFPNSLLPSQFFPLTIFFLLISILDLRIAFFFQTALYYILSRQDLHWKLHGITPFSPTDWSACCRHHCGSCENLLSPKSHGSFYPSVFIGIPQF